MPPGPVVPGSSVALVSRLLRAGVLGTELLPCSAFACGAFFAVFFVAGLQRGGELLLAGEGFGQPVTRDGGVLVDFEAVLGFEEGRHDEFLAAEVVACRWGRFAPNSLNGPWGTVTSIDSNGTSGTVSKVALVTPVLPLMKVWPCGFDRDPVAVQDRDGVGERRAAVADEVHGAFQRHGQHGGVDDRRGR